jgi:hypothetical protein
MGTRRQEISASIDLTYHLAKHWARYHAPELLPDIEFAEPIVRDLLKFTDLLDLFGSSARPRHDLLAMCIEARELMKIHNIPWRGEE